MDIRRIFFSILLSIVPLAYVVAGTATIDGIRWTYTVSSTGATIGDGSSPAVSITSPRDITIPSKINGYEVNCIAPNAFYQCRNIRSITIPDSVKQIGRIAFIRCSGLTNVVMGSGVTNIADSVFYGCDNITSITIPQYVCSVGVPSVFTSSYNRISSVEFSEGVTSIGKQAFYNCTNLTSLTIPVSVTNIGSSAFRLCSKLNSVTIPKSVTSIGDSAFIGCRELTSINISDLAAWCNISFGDQNANPLCNSRSRRLNINGVPITDLVIPDGVTSIGDYAFYNCTSIKSLTIPESVTSIGKYAFSGCSEINSAIIPESIISIGKCAFQNCSALAEDDFVIVNGVIYQYTGSGGSVDIPYGVVSVGASAFINCTDLLGVTIPNTVINIEDHAFSGCSRLMSVTIPNSVLNIGYNAFYNCSGLTSVTIPDSVTTIGDSAFYGCIGLTSMTIPDSVTSIGRNAFYGCSGLTSVAIGNGVASIGYSAFKGCSSLISVTIPDSVKSIGEHAFTYCNDSLYDTMTIPNVLVVDGWVVGYTQSLKGSLDLTPARGIAGGAFVACDKLTDVILPDCAVSIEPSVFARCSNLKSVTIPDSVTSIGEDAFFYCSGLKSVTTGSGVTSIGRHAFYYCGGLTSLTIGSSVTNIGNDAFYNCGGLKSVTVPQYVLDRTIRDVFVSGYSSITNITCLSTVTNIGNSAFTGCLGLKSVVIPSGVLNIGESAFNGCSLLMDVTIPDSVMDIGDNAFYGCIGLTSMTIPDSVTSIGRNAFYGCSGLTSVAIGNGVASIGYSAFKGCSSLISVTIPDSITSLGGAAFFDCSGLTSVTIGNGVTNIGGSAFYGCSGLTSVMIGNGVTSIGNYAFKGCRLTSVTIPDCVTSIGNYAFKGCGRMTSVTIPDCVISIGDGAFYDCGLTSVTIPNSVTSIGSMAFYRCPLTSVIIPDSVVTMGDNAFYGCDRLETIYLSQDYNGAVSFYQSPTKLIRYAPRFTINFDANGGDGGFESEYYYSDKVVAPDNVVRLGYVFAGWSPEVYTGLYTNDMNYIAQWIPNKYEVTFDANGGEGSRSVELDYESEIVAPIMSREGYTFVGWEPEISRVPLGGATYVACWQVNQYIVLFNANGGEGGISVLQDYGAAIVPPTVTKVGFDFTGWEPEITETVPASNVTYCAKWDRHTYRVRLELCGGSCEISELGVEFLATIGELPLPVKDDGVFIGWWTEPEGGELVDDTMVVTEDTTIYAHWLYKVADPVVTPGDGAVFKTDSRDVSIKCETDGATIYYSTTGKTPKLTDDYLYTGPFTITDTATIKAVAVFGKLKSEYVTASIIKKLLTLEDALDSSSLIQFETSTENPWLPILDDGAKVGDGVARSAEIGDGGSTWITATMEGSGMLSFWCKVSCEHDDDGAFTWDRLMVYTNDVAVGEWFMDGESDWVRREVVFSAGVNTVKWMYYKDEEGFSGDDCAWLDEVVWTPSGPVIEGDDGANITGDSEKGYTVIPSDSNKDVVVTIPEGVEPEKVTVEVSADVETVKANGANVKVMNEGYDIAAFLDLAAVTSADGVINLAEAKVTDDVVKEALDTASGADIKLSPTDPSITTANTRPGLKYTFVEGQTIEELAPTEQYKWGDNTPFKPTPSIKGGTSGFYTIKVEK